MEALDQPLPWAAGGADRTPARASTDLEVILGACRALPDQDLLELKRRMDALEGHRAEQQQSAPPDESETFRQQQKKILKGLVSGRTDRLRRKEASQVAKETAEEKAARLAREEGERGGHGGAVQRVQQASAVAGRADVPVPLRANLAALSVPRARGGRHENTLACHAKIPYVPPVASGDYWDRSQSIRNTRHGQPGKSIVASGPPRSGDPSRCQQNQISASRPPETTRREMRPPRCPFPSVPGH